MNVRNALTALAVVAMVCWSAVAADATTKPSGPPVGAGGTVKAQPDSAPTTSPTTTQATEEDDPVDALPPYYQTMIKECNLDEATQKKLALKWKEHAAEWQAWEKAHADERTGLQRDLLDAHREHDKDAEKLLADKLAELAKQRKAYEDKLDAETESVLDAKQRMTWEGYVLYIKAIGPFVDLRLEEDQYQRARNICMRKAPAMMKVKDNKVEADKIYDELYQSIRDRVLTAEQRNKLDHPTTAPATQPAKTAAPEATHSGIYLEGTK